MLRKTTLENFIKRLASGEPVPGGGSAAALAAALGTALALMAVKITLPKTRKETARGQLKKAQKSLNALVKSLTLLIDKDAEVYSEVAKAFKLPKNTPKEAEKRQKKIQAGLKAAAETPLKTATLSFEAGEIIKSIKVFISKNLSSDIETAGFLIDAALKGATANVRINLAGIKDKKFQEKIIKSLPHICRDELRLMNYEL